MRLLVQGRALRGEWQPGDGWDNHRDGTARVPAEPRRRCRALAACVSFSSNATDAPINTAPGSANWGKGIWAGITPTLQPHLSPAFAVIPQLLRRSGAGSDSEAASKFRLIDKGSRDARVPGDLGIHGCWGVVCLCLPAGSPAGSYGPSLGPGEVAGPRMVRALSRSHIKGSIQ